MNESLDRVRLACRNNAVWCDTMCRAHGQPTEMTSDLWICRGQPPRFHSQVTTLAPNALEAILREQPNGFKDGFNDIPADQHGYRILFMAKWIWLAAPNATKTKLEWRRITTDRDLQNWEAGWAFGDEDASQNPRQFPEKLLEDPNHAFLAGYRRGEFAAGCILNLTDPVCGLSNTFTVGIGLAELWQDLATVAAYTFLGYAVVGYERGQDLRHALAAGFEPIGDLNVWVK